MTSWKERINYVSRVLEILINNSFRPNKVILNLAIEEFPKKNKELPNNLLNLLKYDNFEIYWVEKNTNVFKKLIPTLNRFKEDIIITTDDDVLYPYDMIEIGLKEFKKIGENQPMSFGGDFTTWDIGISSHFGPFSIVKYKFFNEKLNELYKNTTEERIKNGIQCFDDLLYTYAALLNGYKYLSGKYSILNEYFNSPKLNSSSFSDDYSSSMFILLKEYHKYIRDYIFIRYNITIHKLIKDVSLNK